MVVVLHWSPMSKNSAQNDKLRIFLPWKWGENLMLALYVGEAGAAGIAAITATWWCAQSAGGSARFWEKERRIQKNHKKIWYGGCFSQLTLIIGIFRETIISSKINSLPELLKDWADFELPMSISRLFAGIQPSLPVLRFLTYLKKI